MTRTLLPQDGDAEKGDRSTSSSLKSASFSKFRAMYRIFESVFSYYEPHKRLLVIDVSSAVLSGLLDLAFPLAVGAFVDKLLPDRDWLLIVEGACGLLVLYVANAVLMNVVTYWGHVLGVKIEEEMRWRAFSHLQSLSIPFFDRQKTGHLITQLTRDLEDIGELAHHGPEDLLIAAMTLVGVIALMFVVDGYLAVIAALSLPFVGFVTLRYGRAMTRAAVPTGW